MPPLVEPLTTEDAVVLIPGIMGSVLRDARTGDTLWGFDDPSLFIDAWVTGHSLARLTLDQDEREGRYGRVQVGGLLRKPAYAPGFLGLEPYTAMISRIQRVLRDPAALLQFGYDWRLPVAHNGRLLKEAAAAHLEAWRRHPRGSESARLVLVAHSMGGLVARYWTQVLGDAADVRMTVTLGTPYHGSVIAVELLARGSGAPVPLPRKRMKSMARTMPGVYDLLPSYRCVDEGRTARQLSGADVAALGGDRELAQVAFDDRALILQGEPGPLHLLVGVEQPTNQSVKVSGGALASHRYSCDVDDQGRIMRRVDRFGDSTVPRLAARAFQLSPMTQSQSHGALPGANEAAQKVRDLLLDEETGAALGGAPIGLQVPDVVRVGDEVVVAIRGELPVGLGCRVYETGPKSDPQVSMPAVRPDGDGAVVRFTPSREGLYRVAVSGGGASPVTQLVMVVPPATPATAEF